MCAWPATCEGPPPANADLRRLRACLPAMRMRAELAAAIRDFFVARDYLEVATPVCVSTVAQERHIDAVPAAGGWLRTSPELHMKRLVAAGYSRIFQIGPCFRRGEFGVCHHPEFGMLEWYRLGAGYRDVLRETRELLITVTTRLCGRPQIDYRGRLIDLRADWHVCAVARAFAETAGWNPVRDFDADRFDRDLTGLVEPQLPFDRPAVLTDFPVQRAALAACRADDPPVAERWELYLAGMELANAFSELTDAVEQRRRFEACAAERAAGGDPVYPLDEDFLAALEAGLPRCAGVALGLDRWLMVLCGADNLDAVLPFRPIR